LQRIPSALIYYRNNCGSKGLWPELEIKSWQEHKMSDGLRQSEIGPILLF
jgi:hypothetical protein